MALPVDDRGRVKELFAEAIAQPAATREDFLSRACDGDVTLRDEVRSLVDSYESAGDFFDRPLTMGTSGTPVGILSRAARRSLSAGSRLGPYEIIDVIGSGGMGEVYRARDTRLDRIVAVKVLPATMAADPEARKRFEQEARTISRVSHPHICALYDVGHQPGTSPGEDGVEYLVMEYLDGESLATRLRRGALETDLLVRYAGEIADALERAHKHGIVHRDLKPSNIMLTDSGAKLVDFGIAKLHDADADSDAIVGTVAYMSPEQLRGESLDSRSDLFSFGAVLYEMATGRRAFQAADAAGVRERILAGAVPTIPDQADVAGLGKIIVRALAVDRGDRYASAANMRADLHALSGGAAPRQLGARRALAAVVAIGACAAIGFAVWANVNRGDSRVPGATQPVVAVLPFKPPASGTTDEKAVALALADAVIAQLGSLRSVTVRPLAVSSRFGSGDPRNAGQALAADLVVGGDVLRAGDTLRVNMFLLRVGDNRTLWSDHVDSPWRSVFTIQDVITREVARALAVNVSGEDRARASRRRTADATAYEAYLKGRYFWNLRTAAGLRKALEYFQQSIDHDPAYAAPYAGMADTYALLGSMPYAVMPAAEAGAKARAAALDALARDPTLVDAHVSLAFVTYSFDWDWARGEEEFKKAIELDPNYATAHYWYSLFLNQIGRADAGLREAERARELEPLSLVGTYSVGLSHYYLREYPTAREYIAKTLEIAPSFPPALRLLGSVQLAEGQTSEAVATFTQLNAVAPDNSLHEALLAYAHGRAGHRARAETILRALETPGTRFVPAAHVAMGYVGVGSFERSFTWFEKAIGERSQALTFLKSEPLFDSIRADVRFQTLMREVRFP